MYSELNRASNNFFEKTQLLPKVCQNLQPSPALSLFFNISSLAACNKKIVTNLYLISAQFSVDSLTTWKHSSMDEAKCII